MSNLDPIRTGAAPLSKSIALACALAIGVLASAGVMLLIGAGGRSPADAEVVGWVEPLRVQANDVERETTSADLFLRLYVLQGKAGDAKRFEESRARINERLEAVVATAKHGDRDARQAAAAFVDAARKWLDLADQWFKAARSETVDASRVAVMARISEAPLEYMTTQRAALGNALDDARDARVRAAEESAADRGRRLAVGVVLVSIAALLGLWLAWSATRGAGGGRGVDFGLMRAVLDQLPDAVAIFGEDGRVLVSNLPAARAVDGRDPSSGRLALYGGQGDPVSDEDSPLVRALGGQHVHERDFFAERLDGSLAPVEVHAEPILDNGRATAAVVVMRDRGEETRVQAEIEALAEARARAEAGAAEAARRAGELEAQLAEASSSLATTSAALAEAKAALAEAQASLAEAAAAADAARNQAASRDECVAALVGGAGAVGVAHFGADGMRLLEANEHALAMLGERRRARDVRGSALLEIAPGAEASGLLDLFRKVAASGEPYTDEEYEARGLRHGSSYWRFALVPLGPGPGAPADELVMMGVDVTEVVEQRAAAQAPGAAAAAAPGDRDWSIEDVLLAISNDLRTPILSIQGMVGLFRQKYAEAVPDVTALHYLELTQRNADQIATLIDDLVGLSSLGHEELRVAEIPLSAAIEEAWRASPRPGIELRVAGPLPTVRADRAKLMRSFRDLFDAAQHLKRDGGGAWIHVRVRDLGQQWEIELADNGTGVATEEEGERLFGPLARNVVNVPNNGGPTLVANGLGLAAVRRIAELHGGTASVTGSPEGGTKYSFTIDK
jgi:signal transduction histidine kinase/CHASE3 domain sensor protein